MRPRLLLPLAACLVTAFLLGRWTAPSPDPPPAHPETREATSAPAPGEGRGTLWGSPRIVEAPESRPEVVAEDPPAQDEAERNVAAWIDVELERPAGASPGRGLVFAVPAGTPADSDLDAFPHVEVFDATGASVPLPRAGRWDVGYRGSWGVGTAPGIRVSEGSRVDVRLALRALRPVAIRFANGDARAWCEGRWARVDLTGTLDGRRVGTREALMGRLDDADLHAGPLPVGVDYEVGLTYRGEPDEEKAAAISFRCPYPAWKLRADREVVRAGDVVTLRLVEQARLEIHVELSSAPSADWSPDLGTHVLFRTVRDGRDLARTNAVLWATPPHVRENPTRFETDPGPMTLHWESAALKQPGRMDLDLRPGETCRLDLVLDLDPHHAPKPNPVPTLRVRLAGARDEEWQGETVVYTADPLDADEDYAEKNAYAAGEVLEIPVWSDWERATEVAGFEGHDRVAPPARIDQARHEATLVFERAGWLVVVPKGWPRPGLGRHEIRRADRRPILATSWDDQGESSGAMAGPSCGVQPGLLLGPLVPGPHRFEVLLGGTVIERVSATVEAGVVGELRLSR